MVITQFLFEWFAGINCIILSHSITNVLSPNSNVQEIMQIEYIAQRQQELSEDNEGRQEATKNWNSNI